MPPNLPSSIHTVQNSTYCAVDVSLVGMVSGLFRRHVFSRSLHFIYSWIDELV